MSVSLNQILEMPNAALLAEQINSALEKEKAERNHFYKIVDTNKSAEFINGKIIFDLPDTFAENKVVGKLLSLLGTFVGKNNLGFVGQRTLLVSLTRNDYKPDICYFGNDKSKNFTKDFEFFPAPDFVVEVLSDSTAEKDRTTKFQDYAAHGVSEYWIVDARNETIEQYYLQNEEYGLLLKAKDGTINSVVLPDFKIQIRAAFDEQTNLEELKKLI